MIMLVVTGTDHSIPHLYDINTFKCYLPPNFQDMGVNGAINQVNWVSSMHWSEDSLLTIIFPYRLGIHLPVECM